MLSYAESRRIHGQDNYSLPSRFLREIPRELLHEVRLKGRKPTNVAFGGPDGRTVFVTLQDRGAIEAFRTELPGRETGH